MAQAPSTDQATAFDALLDRLHPLWDPSGTFENLVRAQWAESSDRDNMLIELAEHLRILCMPRIPK